jgi:hypothetical protein
VARDERGDQCVGIADSARHLDRLAAERLAPLLLAHEVDRRRQPREQHGAERAVARVELRQHVLEHGDQRLVGGAALRAGTPEAERRARHGLDGAEEARAAHRALERGARAVVRARTPVRVAERQQERELPRLVGRPEGERLEPALVVRHRLLVA